MSTSSSSPGSKSPPRGPAATTPRSSGGSKSSKTKAVLDEALLTEPVGDLEALESLWREEILGVQILFQNEAKTVASLMKYIQSIVRIDEDAGLAMMARQEARIGNLLQTILVALAYARIAARMFQEQRMPFLAVGNSAPSSRRSKEMIESHLMHERRDYRKIRQIGTSAELNVDVLNQMREMCNIALDRLRQMSMIRMAELRRLNPGSYEKAG